MKEKIDEAKKLLEDNGYVVVKLTKRQLEDSKKCEDMVCVGCSCNVCIVQQ